MSHLKNMQAFGKLIGICTGLGETYKPGQQNLQVEALNTLLYNAQQIFHELSRANTEYDYATNNREALFKKTATLGSRICKVLSSSGADPGKLDSAHTILRKMRGYRRKRAAEGTAVATTTEPPAEKAKSPSVYGRNYASIAYQFSQLIEVVTSEQAYQPYESDLKADALNQVAAALHTMNAEVTKAEVNLAKARRMRNEMLYAKLNSMLATARAVTAYACGVYGYLSPQHVELVRLNFTKP